MKKYEEDILLLEDQNSKFLKVKLLGSEKVIKQNQLYDSKSCFENDTEDVVVQGLPK